MKNLTKQFASLVTLRVFLWLPQPLQAAPLLSVIPAYPFYGQMVARILFLTLTRVTSAAATRVPLQLPSSALPSRPGRISLRLP